jgi:hypothetical protein
VFDFDLHPSSLTGSHLKIRRCDTRGVPDHTAATFADTNGWPTNVPPIVIAEFHDLVEFLHVVVRTFDTE